MAEDATDKQVGEEQNGGKDLRNLLVPDVERWKADNEVPIARLSEVHKSFGANHVLNGLSLTVATGKITIIIGASGSGKSVLIKHLNGLIRPDSGEVELFGEKLSALSADGLDKSRKRIGTMFQNYALFDSMTVVENVAFPLVENNAMGVDEAHVLARDLLVDLGLEQALQQYPSTLSGGMKKRVSLARAIVSNPEIVLFDEPTTGLDPVMMEFVDNMIKDITVRFGLTSVIISHDLATIFRLADSIAVLHEGQIIAQGSPEEIRANDDERVQKLVGGASKADIEVGAGASDASGDDDARDAVVKISELRKAFGDVTVLDGVDFVAPKNKLTVLIGGSGSGKSVMMKHILGLLRGDSGKIEVFGKDLQTMSESEIRELRTHVGMLFQHAALFDSMTVRENVAFPLIERRVCKPAEARKRVDKLLEQLKLTSIADSSTLQISSGQQKRVSLARALVTEPQLMIYDEPTTGQDPLMSRYVEEMIVEVQTTFEVTSIVISHDMASAFRIADYIAMLHKGVIIASGTPAAILEIEDERVHEFVYAADVAEAIRKDKVEPT
ncbi:MAG: ABC transporter ATP-binding protein [Bradymonadaceae bacterium]|nr:ABC transporter ATP-binding protein [Lujinxingiaceae bacterium]